MASDAVQYSLEYIRGLISRGSNKEALELIESLEQVKPVTLAVVNAKAMALMALDRPRDAEACYTWAIQFHSVGPDEVEALHNLWRLACVNHDPGWADWARYEYMLCRSCVAPDEACKEYLKAKQAEMTALENRVVKDPKDPHALMDLGWLYWRMRQRVAAIVCFAAALCHGRDGYPQESDLVPAIDCESNLRTLYENLSGSGCPVAILLSDEPDDTARCRTLSKVIGEMGKRVYLVSNKGSCLPVGSPSPIDGGHQAFCLKCNSERLCEIEPCADYDRHPQMGDLTEVFNWIYAQLPHPYALLISSRRMIQDLADSTSLRHKVKLLSDHFSSGPVLERHSAFGYFGDYTEYISRIYISSVLENINQPSTCVLSVIIPTRNSPASLSYTLRTCLDQAIPDLEILVCDNSTTQDGGTRKLVEELNDTRIRYVRPPRLLNLTRSFEYAFLQARGEFMFSMGSDDGITFGGLRILAEVLEALPECDVIQWDRIFYVWPDSLSDRSGLFQTVRPYRRGRVNVSFYNPLNHLHFVLKNPNHVGLLPMLYINSGMRRRYFQKLLERTGQLWDGLSQDVYISVVNCLINKTIPLVEYPLTVAGMGGNSFGVRMSQGWKSKAAVEVEGNEYLRNTIGYVVPSKLEMLVPNGHVDSTNLYQSFLRAIQTGCNPGVTKDLVDWKWAFIFMMHQSPKDSLFHDRFIKTLKWAAEQHGPEFGKWFRDEVMPHAYTPPPARPPSSPGGKSYTEGILKDGGMMLNSEKMGVTNVYEACQLFERLLDAADTTQSQ